MPTHTEGYVTDLAYLAHFQRELTPGFIRFCLLMGGADLPKVAGNEPFRYLELGYGQGLSLNIHAAAVPGEFWGTDFMPEHAANAQGMAEAAGLGNVHALNMSFADLDAYGAAGNLPDFDLITLHGVWSWINAENREYIRNVIRRHLKPGGVVHVSYNALPGWASFMPVRELLIRYAAASGGNLDSATQTQQAFAFARSFAASGAAFFAGHPHVKEKLDGLTGEDVHYLAHEYMNRNWQPFYFEDVEKEMALAQCRFVTSIDSQVKPQAYLPPEVLLALDNAANRTMRETLYDFAVNRTFRTDLYIKDGEFLSPDERMARLNGLCFALSNPLSFFKQMHRFRIPTQLGAVLLRDEAIMPLLAALAEKSCVPKSFDFLRNNPRLEGMAEDQLLYLVAVLTSTGYLHVANTGVPQETRDACARLNRVLCEQAMSGEGQPFLASPVLGTAIAAPRMERLFLLAQANGMAEPDAWADFACRVYEDTGSDMTDSNGEPIWPENVGDIAAVFAREQLPFLRAMGALPARRT
ncbi:MAG: class I SAM-dependent methyltransferase [Alistipes senegalensis]|nr:class I SAM-dependent methyltransferase [Oxalobacter formigenes]MCM1281928.1 class I SAM-dependent methyltransferase [Alistipes senegalensis]